MKNILLVEDDPEIHRLLALHLTGPEFSLHTCETGIEAYGQAAIHHFDLLILDLMLPDVDGMEVCRAVRRKDGHVPIIMLTARCDEADKLAAFGIGVDDYITKPFGIQELVARIRAVLRRSDQGKTLLPQDSKIISYRDLYIELDKKKASIRGQRLDLTLKEFDLLALLAAHPGKAFSRRQLLEAIWGIAFSGYEHTVTAHINRLRLKIEPYPSQPEYILTCWGTGYRFAE